ncbi:copper-binding protein [Dyella ginsengisoli]|uniref:copper-binding protein n=1 Tax=Dyella ginsengisoli TaxID=363848 RepID=UPI0003672637|nr:copper-binding protein [Dyella ginsengisoli]
MKHGFHIASALVALTLASTSMAATQAKPMKGMAGMQDMQRMQHPQEAQGIGIVKAIDIPNGTITLQHQEISSIGWPAMTMAFKVASPHLLQVAKIGDTVNFTLHPSGMTSTVTSITVQP